MAATWVRVGANRSVVSVQATTEAAPTVSTDGIALDGIGAISIWLEADPGQTLSGTGQLDVYVYDAMVGAWALAPLIPFGVPSGAAGKQRVVLGSVVIDNPRGRIAPIANGVGVSAGGLTLYICCTSNWHKDIRAV